MRVLEEMAGKPALYHLPSDPGQHNSVIDDNEAAANRLHAAYVQFLEELGMAEQYLRHRRTL